MTAHQVSSFNNSCIRLPISRTDRRPVPSFERPVSNIRFDEERPPVKCGGIKPKSAPANKMGGERVAASTGETSSARLIGGDAGEKGVFCMADFFESIPDYNDINHLSEHDFYGKLDVLKRKQAQLNEACFRRNLNAALEVDVPLISVHSCDEAALSPELCAERQSGMRRSKSVDSNRLTATSPFRMTQRDEEQRMLNELMQESRCAFRPDDEPPVPKSPIKRASTRKTHKIPATSKYPMYDQIVADQEKRSQLVKLNSMLELQSKIRPFHFATDKSHTPADCTEPLYTPAPDPFDYRQPPAHKPRRFRARPCPRKLFSNYFYHKQWEEEQFRALNHRLRADELLQQAATPPSMRKAATRKKAAAAAAAATAAACHPVTANCSERSQSVASSQRSRRRSATKRAKRAGGPANNSGEFVTTCTHPFRFETLRRSAERRLAAGAASSASGTGTATSCSKSGTRGLQFLRSTPQPIYPAARPNLAANLRAEWARKKICDLTCGNMPPKARGGDGARSAWGVRKMPGWKALYYDHTNEEDISLRLCTRRAEERLRNEEHAISMELMRQRVRATPLLLEGATMLPTTATAGTHRLRCDVLPVGHGPCGAAVAARTKSRMSGGAGRTRSARRSGRSTAEMAAGSDDESDEDDNGRRYGR